MNSMIYKKINSTTQYGTSGTIGIQLLVSVDNQEVLNDTKLQNFSYKLVEDFKNELEATIRRTNPEFQEKAKKEKESLLALFTSKIFAEEIPNEYCKKWCCRHLPWFIVTTEIGRFKIGWRKRVIEINWEDTTCEDYAVKLFPNEDATRVGKMIHAWSLESAKTYIEAVINAATREKVRFKNV